MPSIVQLDSDVVDKIAAGEVVQRPVNALKELLDNCLDAGAKRINVTVKDGGLKLLLIQDDGCGVQVEDLPLMCKRHATSKLRSFGDLPNVGTLGFRGEALASISFVAHLTVTTRTATAQHGTTATFSDGALVSSSSCAAGMGTTLKAEDMFFSMPSRQRALRSGREEYARMVRLVSHYAVFWHNVSFSLRREGSAPDVATPVSATRYANIKRLYGPNPADGLKELNMDVTAEGEPNSPNFEVKAFVSTQQYKVTSSDFILMVNDRLVSCAPLKRAIQTVYTTTCTDSKFFVILELKVPPDAVDVNVHPTKEEVTILHQDAIISGVCDALRELLIASAPIRIAPASEAGSLVPRKQDRRSSDGALRVRTDPFTQTLADMPARLARSAAAALESQSQGQSHGADAHGFSAIVDSIKLNSAPGFEAGFPKHSVVGVTRGPLAILQLQSELYQLNMAAVSQDMAYQRVAEYHGRFRAMELKPPICLRTLLDAVSSLRTETDSVYVSTDTVIETLICQAGLLREELSIHIDEATGELCTLPDVLNGVVPRPRSVVTLVESLATTLSSGATLNAESACKALAETYALTADSPAEQITAIVQMLRGGYRLSKSLISSGALCKLTQLRRLYQVFERC